MSQNLKSAKVSPVLTLIVGVIIVIAIWVGGVYNSLITKSTAVDSAWAQIDNNLQRRNDLIPNLVSTVKGYAAHEEELFTQIADARAQLAGGGSPTQLAQADSTLTAGLGRLLALAEAYPDLKANTNFVSLQDELAGTENRLATARKDYNDQVQTYNVKIKSVPTNLLAGLFGFTARDFYQTADTAREVPLVNFE
jgi:LemA protein